MQRHLAIVLVFCLVNDAVVALSVEENPILIDAPMPSNIKDVIGQNPSQAPPSPALSRARRETTSQCGYKASAVTSSQKEEIVKAHNNCRGKERATNELMMEWDDGLAGLAQELADQCKFSHGLLNDCNGDRVGQNLFLTSGGSKFPAVNFTQATESWNSERNYYDFSNQKCQAGKDCGHWSQVVGAKSREVGCGVSLCSSAVVGSGTWSNAVIIVCDYSPAGNVAGEAIFLPGPPCTACTTVTGSLTYRGYKCQDNLCVPCIPKEDSSCQCGEALTCQNEGVYSVDTCVCNCPPGFYGAMCENSCVCADVYGSSCRGWTSFCSDPLYEAFMKANCAKTCDLCDVPDSCLK